MTEFGSGFQLNDDFALAKSWLSGMTERADFDYYREIHEPREC
jgi:hypothetical protein